MFGRLVLNSGTVVLRCRRKVIIKEPHAFLRNHHLGAVFEKSGAYPMDIGKLLAIAEPGVSINVASPAQPVEQGLTIGAELLAGRVERPQLAIVQGFRVGYVSTPWSSGCR